MLCLPCRSMMAVSSRATRQHPQMRGVRFEGGRVMCGSDLGKSRSWGPSFGAVDAILEGDRTALVRQRHTARRLLERLGEHAPSGFSMRSR